MTNAPGPLIMPPKTRFARARRWQTFCDLFQPLPVVPGKEWLIWEPYHVPPGQDGRFWWTVLDPMDGTGFYLAPGFHVVNRMGYIRCACGWGGEADDHPPYLFKPSRPG